MPGARWLSGILREESTLSNFPKHLHLHMVRCLLSRLSSGVHASHVSSKKVSLKHGGCTWLTPSILVWWMVNRPSKQHREHVQVPSPWVWRMSEAWHSCHMPPPVLYPFSTSSKGYYHLLWHPNKYKVKVDGHPVQRGEPLSSPIGASQNETSLKLLVLEGKASYWGPASWQVSNC